MQFVEKENLVIGTFPVTGVIAPEIEIFTTTRIGGVSPKPFDSPNLGRGVGDRDENVSENISILLNASGIKESELALADQVHGTRVRVVEGGGTYKKTDGLITSGRGVTLAIKTADCYPVIIYSPPENTLAALHVGRSGASDGIIGKAFDILLSDFRIRVDYSISLIGPGICSKCYRVNEGIARRFRAGDIKRIEGHPHLDLLSCIRNQLKTCGMKRRNIFAYGICTSCRPGLFFSHRRDGGLTGRQWTLARIK